MFELYYDLSFYFRRDKRELKNAQLWQRRARGTHQVESKTLDCTWPVSKILGTSSIYMGGIRGPIPQIEIRFFALPSSPHPSRSDKQSSMAFGGVALPGSGSVANTNPAHLNGSGGHAGANAAHSKMNGNGNGIGAGEEEKKVTVAGKESSLEQGLSSVHGIVPTLQ